MKQIFKKLLNGEVSPEVGQQQQGQTVLTKERKYPKEVEMIHTAFNTESERLLREAKSVLENNVLDDVVKNKAGLAEQLGFTSIKEVVDKSAHDKVIQDNVRVVQAIQQASLYIPTHKWIPESSVKQICEKWGLVMGGVSMYKGFLPSKNLLEIQDFKNKYYDKLHYASELRFFGDTSVRFFRTEKECREYVNRRKVDPFTHGVVDKLNSTDTLSICAPLKDMEVPRNATIENGYKIREIPDPIVLARRDFEGIEGYYIVTAWGDEASDEMVVNQNNN